jgi:regulator of sigma E protease
LLLILKVTQYVVMAVVAISLIILVHELGHFIGAKAVGMRVEVFSIGFWKRLFGFKIGDTDYRVSLIPLGGYVKVTGEMPQEEGQGEPYEFWSKTPGQRALFVIGGVTGNVVLALVLFIVAFAIGVPFAPGDVGQVEQGSPAWKAGIKHGDVIVRVGDEANPIFEDLQRKVMLGGGASVALQVRRGDRTLSLKLQPEQDKDGGLWKVGLEPVFEPTVTGLGKVGGPEGPSPAKDAGVQLNDRILAVNGVPTPTAADVSDQMLRYPNDDIAVRVKRGDKELTLHVLTSPDQRYMVGISGQNCVVKELEPGSIAQESGILVGDRITAVGEQPVASSVGLQEALRAAHGPVELHVERGGHALVLKVDVPDPLAAEDFMFGLTFQSSTTLSWVRQDGPAWQAGMRPGDTVTSVAGREVSSWDEVMSAGAEAGTEARQIQWLRDGKSFSASITPALMDTGEGGRIGVVMDWPVMEPRQYGALRAIGHGVADFKQTISDIVVSLGGIVTRKISSQTLGGIVTIARVAYRAAEFGLGKLLYLTAYVSLSIAALNVLPVPVLDGGHLLFLAIEKLRGRRVSEKVMSIAQTVGFVLLILLVVYVTRNDILNWVGRR